MRPKSANLTRRNALVDLDDISSGRGNGGLGTIVVLKRGGRPIERWLPLR